jgi:hypothetical protein
MTFARCARRMRLGYRANETSRLTIFVPPSKETSERCRSQNVHGYPPTSYIQNIIETSALDMHNDWHGKIQKSACPLMQ